MIAEADDWGLDEQHHFVPPGQTGGFHRLLRGKSGEQTLWEGPVLAVKVIQVAKMNGKRKDLTELAQRDPTSSQNGHPLCTPCGSMGHDCEMDLTHYSGTPL